MPRLLTFTIGLALAALSLPAAAAAQIPGLPSLPIPGPSLIQPTPFEGAQASPRPVAMSVPPRHPYMAPNERSNLHDDAYMTDTYRGPGPLGRGTSVNSAFFVRECGSITFDSRDRIVTVCVGVDGPVLALIDPDSLNVLAAYALPLRDLGSILNVFSDFSGGGYFYLDHRDHAIIPTTQRHILDVATVEGGLFGPQFQVVKDYDVSGAVPAGQGIVSVLPDWSGRIWFVTRGGVVGTIDPGSGAVKSMQLPGEGISNSFSVDETGGVFIVSDRAMYRFDAGPAGEPTVSWREVYANVGIKKPGQSDAGSGTTPTVMDDDFVAITDNGDPMGVVVYRRGRNPVPQRQVCSQPVFDQGKGNTDQSLIGTDDSMIVENNYGYSGPLATQFGGTTEPGLARVDIIETKTSTAAPSQPSSPAKKVKKKKRKKGKRAKGKRGKRKKKKKKRPVVSATPGDPVVETTTEYGCRLVWRSEERAPSVVPKLSLANGLVYTYTKPKRDDGADAWYFTALDFRSGATVYRRLAGIGIGFNNNYAPVTLGPDGAAYVGTLGGVVRLKDQ